MHKIKFISIFVIVFLYSNLGRGTWKAPEPFADLIEKSQKNDKDAQNTIVQSIYNGVLRFPKSYNKYEKKMYSWLEVVQPNESFQHKIVRFIFLGHDNHQDRLIKELQKRAGYGDAYAQRVLGSVYFHTNYFGTGEHRKAGIKWYEKASAQGHARAQVSLALRKINDPSLSAQGLILMKSAANAGLPEAQASLASFYAEGRFVKKNLEKHEEWLFKAALNGDYISQADLSSYYFQGIMGFEKNIHAGLKWLKRAVKNNHVDATYFLGSLYYLGLYVDKNKSMGLKLLNKAANMGSKEAQRELNRIKIH